MAAVTVCSNFEAQETSLSLFPFFAWMFAVKWWDQCHELSVLNVEFGASSFTVLFPFIMRLFSPSLGGLKAFWLYVVFQSLSHVQLFPNCNMQALLSFTISWSLLKLISIVLVMPFNHLVLCCPLLFLPSIFPSIRAFSKESAHCIRWPKYWCFSFSISPSNEKLGLISFRIDWFDLFAEQGIPKSLLQHHGLKASVLKCSAFFYCPDLAHIKENLRHIMSSHSYISVISYSPTKKKAKEELFSYATMPLLHLTN